MFALLFTLAVVPAICVGLRIMSKKDILVWDLLILFTTLYLWAIPCKDFLFEHEFPEFLGNTYTVGTLCLYMWLLLLADLFYANYKRGNNFLNISRFFRLWHPVAIKPSFLWVILLIGLIYLYNITNYSAMDADNPEANNQFGSGNNMPLPLRVFALSIRPIYPLLLIITYTFKSSVKLYGRLRIVCMVLLIAGLLLGSKTNMTFNLIFFLIYFYSMRRDLMTRKNILLGGAILAVTFFVFFPISQGLRMYKQYYVENMSVHDFKTVLTAYVTQAVDIDMSDRVERYQNRRGMNVYTTFDFVCNTNYRGNGDMTWSIFRYIIVQRTIMDNRGEILAVMQNSGDVAESIPAWFVCDYGCVFGPIAAIFYLILMFLLFHWMGQFFYLFFKSPAVTFMAMSLILQRCISIEHNPSGDIRVFYATYSIVFVACGILFTVFSKKNRVRRYA